MLATTWDGLAPAAAPASPWRTVVLDLVAVGCFGGCAIAITRSAWVREVVPQAEVSLVLVSMAAACAAMATILAAIVHRLSNDPRCAWISAAFALYGLVGVPATTIGTTFDRGGAPVDAVRLSAHTLVVVLLLVAVRPPRLHPSWGPRNISFLGLLTIAAVAVLAALAPTSAQSLTGFAPLRFTVAGGGVIAGAVLAVLGSSRRSAPLCRIGVGIMVMWFAHAYKIASEQQAVAQPGLTFASVRLLGVLLVLIGLVQLARRALGGVHESHAEHQEELRLARMGLDLVAERDHELRNGLAGLAGVTHLIGQSPQADEVPVLRTAVTAELARLEAMLQAEGGDSSRRPGQAYPPGPALRDVVALRQCAGMDIGTTPGRGCGPRDRRPC